MTNSIFLVAGATGTTGNAVVRELAARGLRVRAIVRREDDRSRALEELGVEVVKGDLLDLDSLRSATTGVTGAYFVYPVSPELVEASVKFAQASKEAGLQIVAILSQLPARPDAHSPVSQAHWLSEKVFENFGVPSTALRATFFAEVLLYVSPLIRQGQLVFPWKPTSVHAPISATDIARVAASVLVDPSRHSGKAYPLCGPQAYTYTEIAALLSRVLEKEVCYKQESVARVVEMMGGDLLLEHHLKASLVAYETGIFSRTNDLTPRITGMPQTSLEEFIERHRTAFV